MKKQLFDLTVEEFTRVLLDYPELIEFKINIYDESGIREKDDDILKGTYDNLNELAESFKFDHPYRKAIKDALNDIFDYDMRLSSLDIYNYLEHITCNFHEEKTRVVLREMDCFYLMIYIEEIDADVLKIYQEKGWELPTYEDKNLITGQQQTYLDYETMREKVYPCRDFMYYNAISLLKRKTDNANVSSPIYLTTRKGEKTDFIRIINAMYELSFFTGKDGTNISKKCVFEEFGKLVNLDFTDYQNLLSKANKGCNADGNSQQNRIFERLKEVSIKKEK